MIVKSVEHDSDDIVAKDVLALAHMSADLAALIFALHHDVKVLIVEREVSGRRTADWIAVVRLALAKLGNLRFRLTRRVVKKVLELRRPRYSRDVNSRARQGIAWVTLIRSDPLPRPTIHIPRVSRPPKQGIASDQRNPGDPLPRSTIHIP